MGLLSVHRTGVAPTVASVIDSVVNLAKRRGLVYPAGEIYGGTKSAWDYGPWVWSSRRTSNGNGGGRW